MISYLFLPDVPQVTVTRDAYSVDVGGSVTLQCSVTADPVHNNVYWRKVDGGTETSITIDNSKYTGSTISNPSLTINTVTFNDTGTYYCYASNSVGTGVSTQVIVAVSGGKGLI